MKKSIIVLTAALALGVPGVAVAEESSDVLLQRLDTLTSRLAAKDAKLEHKSDVLACERAKRRTLERALRTGAAVGSASPCR